MIVYNHNNLHQVKMIDFSMLVTNNIIAFPHSVWEKNSAATTFPMANGPSPPCAVAILCIATLYAKKGRSSIMSLLVNIQRGLCMRHQLHRGNFTQPSQPDVSAL